MTEVHIPNNYTPRDYQRLFFDAMQSGIRRAVLVWHRRSGKDKTALNWLIPESQRRVGAYYHLFPTYNQGQKIIWDGIDKDGFKVLDHFPQELVLKKHETEMKIHLVNGSIYQIVGTDRFDRIVGPNPVGCIFSEYALQDPRAWDLIRPILRENGGWAVFCFTPRGENHGWRLYSMARRNPKWFCELRTVDHTIHQDRRVFTPEDIAEELAEGMDPDLVEQEFFCSFKGSTQGSYYGKFLKEAQQAGRIGRVPWESQLRVDTWWDLGIDDYMAIWFTQAVAKEIRVIDYLQDSGEGLEYYAKELDKKPYVYGTHNAPHDIKVRELGTGKSRLEVAEKLGIKFEVVPDIGKAEGIQAVRTILPRCWFDAGKCERGLDALRSYSKKWDEERKCFKDSPNEDWSSHAADGFRYFGVGFKEPKRKRDSWKKREKPNWMTA
jgi:hypothetical protein